MKGIVVDAVAHYWEGDVPLGLPFSNTVIYEVHVGGFTRNPNSGAAPGKRGTHSGDAKELAKTKAIQEAYPARSCGSY